LNFILSQTYYILASKASDVNTRQLLRHEPVPWPHGISHSSPQELLSVEGLSPPALQIFHAPVSRTGL